MSDFSPSAIFSPSLARQQAASAKDWSYIDGWLSQKCSGKCPPFERNPETLKALLALASLNESADEDRGLLAAVEKKALSEYEDLEDATIDDEKTKILQDLEDALSKEGSAALSSLATASVSLNLPSPCTTTDLAQRLLSLQTTIFDLTQTNDRVTTLHNHFSRELALTQDLLATLQSAPYQTPPTLGTETLTQQRANKQLLAKLPELRDKLSALTAASGGLPKPDIQDIMREEEKYLEQAAVVKDLEGRVKAYHGLPHDVDLARLELEVLRRELGALIEERDNLFEGLVERESPRKPVGRVRRG